MLDKELLNRLFRYAMSLSNQQADAYDLLQSSLVKFLSGNWQSVSNPSAYIRRMIRNQYIDQTRRHARVAFELIENQDALAHDTQSLEDFVINENLVEHIWKMLEAAEREVLFLWAIEGFTTKEIAAEINAPRGTVLSRIHRIRKKIHLLMEQDNPLTNVGGGQSV